MIGEQFALLGAKSIGSGIAFGLICSYMLKRVRVLSKSSVSECAIIFIWAYISYVAAELWAFSGIITLLSASVTMANYAWYNLSPQGKQSSTVIF